MKEIKSLYHLTDDILRFDRILESTGGEMTPELDSEMDMVFLDLKKKLDGAIGYDSYLQDMEKKAKKESERFRNIQNSLKKRRETFREYIKTCMQKIKETNIKTDNSIVYLTEKEKVYYDEEKIPAMFKEVKSVVRLKKDSIKTALKNGNRINGVSVEQCLSITFKERGK